MVRVILQTSMRKYLPYIYSICFNVSFLFLLGVLFVHAESTAPVFTNPLGDVDLKGFLLRIIDAVIVIIFPILVLMIVYVGFRYVAARGNPAEIKNLHQALLWTVVGGAIIIGAKALALGIEATVTQIQNGL